jgi:transcriptional regulator with GAF, ATPase, and Fis domain
VSAEQLRRLLPDSASTPTTAMRAIPEPERESSMGLSDALEGYERTLIAHALSAADGNIADAARRLRTDRANLYRRMRRLGLGGGE